MRDAGAFGLAADETFCERMEAYVDLLLRRNESVNLTAITDFSDICRLHLLDSLAPLCVEGPSGTSPLLSRESKARLIDIGSGAGFPGIVLKTYCPQLSVTLLDARKNRVLFLEEVIRTLELDGEGEIKAVHGRAEEYAHEAGVRGNFDIACARAVAKTSILAEYALPFLRDQGIFVAYKSQESEEEVDEAARALQILGGSVAGVRDYLLPFSDTKRRLVFLKKEGIVPEGYPRRTGVPAKKPL